jgi:hypothetical protein
MAAINFSAEDREVGGLICLPQWIQGLSCSYTPQGLPERVRRIAMLRHDQTHKEGMDEVVKTGFRASAKQTEWGGVLPRTNSHLKCDSRTAEAWS